MSTENIKIRTRFAPSPTGQLHIGGARTALFNYLWAKKNKGDFIFRIEDTDTERNVAGSEETQLRTLKLLSIFPDESYINPGNHGPYKQSQKIQRYLKLANKLIEEKKAYYCFCTSEELKEIRKKSLETHKKPSYSKKCRFLSRESIKHNLENKIPYTIRIKIDLKQEYSWIDLVRGEIIVPAHSLTDLIIVRPNLMPTYNFSVVVDDYDMKISHVLRGEEHIANTPVQIALYHLLGWENNIPDFGHISMVVDFNKEKISKRTANENFFILNLLNKGYSEKGIVNFLALLGWSYKEEEIFTLKELTSLFQLENISPSPTIYDIQKLNWISHQHFSKMEDSYYLNFAMRFFTTELHEFNEKKRTFALLNKERIFCADQLNELANDFFLSNNFHTLEGNLENHEFFKILSQNKKLLNLSLKYFPKATETWDLIVIRNYLKQIMEISQLKGKSFFLPLRIAFSGKVDGYALYDVLYLLNKDNVIKNLKNSIKLIQEN